MKQLKVILSGGGTGGHIYPAISIANEIKLRFPNAEVLFVGAKDRMEMKMVPDAGYPIKGLWISGIQRSLSPKNLLFPIKLLSSLRKSKRIIRDFKPDLVIGTGGFASGPLLRAAHQKKIPSLLQEQNSLPGITNKLLAKKADVICTAYEHMERYFPGEKVVLTGNPVRQDLLQVDNKMELGQKYFKLDPQRKTLLVLGGSLGARRINQLVESQLEEFEKRGLQVIWQTGRLYYQDYKKYEERENLRVLEYLNRMDLAYAAADIIISRAGAGTVSELCIVGKPVVFIPSPNVAEDHQSKNALALAEKDAAVVIAEASVDENFPGIFYPLLESEEKMKGLSLNIKKLAKPFATSNIVDQVEKLIRK